MQIKSNSKITTSPKWNENNLICKTSYFVASMKTCKKSQNKKLKPRNDFRKWNELLAIPSSSSKIEQLRKEGYQCHYQIIAYRSPVV